MPKWTDRLPMPNTYFLMMLREFGTTAAAREAILQGIDEEAAAASGEITLGQQLRQIRNLARLQPPGWALHISTRFVPAVHGPVGFACMSAATLRDALSTMARYGRVRSPYYRLEPGRSGEWFFLRVSETVELKESERLPLLEFLLRSHQHTIETILGRPMREAEHRFAWPAPSYADEYGRHFHGRLVFDAPYTETAVPLAWLDVASPMADATMFQESLRKLEALSLRLDGSDYTVARVEQLLLAHPREDLPLDQAARQLGISGRTLARKLRSAGTTYQVVADDLRRERAHVLLATTGLSIAEVGHRLGYEDAANFGRACRRWFAMSPGQYRRVAPELKGGAARQTASGGHEDALGAN
jgi:AraC-like DNA-binding protein